AKHAKHLRAAAASPAATPAPSAAAAAKAAVVAGNIRVIQAPAVKVGDGITPMSSVPSDLKPIATPAGAPAAAAGSASAAAPAKGQAAAVVAPNAAGVARSTDPFGNPVINAGGTMTAAKA
ncbi:hypothetical protein MNEG_16110, partial [Monoraphidium neglectum]